MSKTVENILDSISVSSKGCLLPPSNNQLAQRGSGQVFYVNKLIPSSI